MSALCAITDDGSAVWIRYYSVGPTTKNGDVITPVFETPLIDRRSRGILCHGTVYTAKSGAHVFGAGTMQWSWGLDDYGAEKKLRPSRLNSVAEKITWNFFKAAGIDKTD